MKIIKLTSDDFIAYRDFRLKSVNESPLGFITTYQEELAKKKEVVKSSLDKNDIYAAIKQNNIIASVGLFKERLEKLKHKAKIGAVYVLPEHRKKGIASQLLEAVFKQAKQEKLMQLALVCIKDNEPALKLYQRHGFEIYGISPKEFQIDGKYYDAYLMMKNLF
jgi:ribosomal protein S18 acetylase RimI-like enzyme